ncbi:predicted cytoskeletal protein [Malacoplasma penetrans HF-2]|uniref:Predicted cytoskeletal protein n=1 Tax=Malacoplasma penetrans (strain HF-2) TaxID=272633 RepID=Q8EWQ0_MALP2|nr:cytoskeletal protein [Malacoplasma penetrans]BAC43944.1 predicted cytoskeletal protein [Malacoplasma penetrans HF-2]
MRYINIERIKQVLARINEKKSIIEKNYFQSLRIFNDMLKVDPDNSELVSDISLRKERLDESVNSTISYLDNLTQTLSLVMLKVIKNKDLLSRHEDEFLLTPPITDKDLSVENEYEKELRGSADNQPLTLTGLPNEDLSFNFNEFNDFVDKINEEFEYASPAVVKQGLLNDQEYSFEDKISRLERSLKEEIEAITIHNEMLERQNINLQEMLIKLEEKDLSPSTLYANRTWDNSELYFSALDKSVNSAVQKFDEVSEKMTNAINFLSINQIENLEKISLPLIKSLETSLKTVTDDFQYIKRENENYKKEVDNYKEAISALKNDCQSKEYELKNSYDSWLSNVRKISELEDIINEQSDDIKKIYEEKNDLISKLESKIAETGSFVNQIVYEKELLLQQNSDLAYEIDKLKRELAGENDLDDYINSVSIQDLVQKEAEKIVEDKINTLLRKYRDEVEKIKTESISYFLNARDNDERVLDKMIQENDSGISNEIAKTVEKLERKLASIENNLKHESEVKERTQDAINDINLLLGEGPYPIAAGEKKLTNKFDQLEQRIEESLERVKTLEEKKNEPSKIVLENEKLDDLFSKSPLYEDFNQRLLGKELEIESLKAENSRIYEENQVINDVLNETIQRITINSGKMREIEELLTKQDYEFMILNDEKNSVIDALYKSIKNRDLDSIDDIHGLTKLNKYDFAKFAKKSLNNKEYNNGDLLEYVKDEIEKIISQEIEALKVKYDEDLKLINEKYEWKAYPDVLNSDGQFGPVTSSHVYQGPVPVYQAIPSINFDGIDQSYFDIEKNDSLKKIINEYVNGDLEDDILEETYEEEIINNSKSDEKEFLGDGNNLLDVSVENGYSPWNPSPSNSEKIIHKKSVVKSKKEDELIKKLLDRNDDLEAKITKLKNLMSDRFNSEIEKSKNLIFNKYTPQFVPAPAYDYSISPDIINEIKQDILQQQIIQSNEIERKINDSINEFRSDNDKRLDILNRKIENINQPNTLIDNSSLVFENSILEDRSALFLEREIISSTDKLLQLQKELLTLESELTHEEKKLIVEL